MSSFDDDEPEVAPVRAHFNPSAARFSRDNGKAPAYVHSRKQEKGAANRITGGRGIVASGAKWKKGDAEAPNLMRVECKATGADSFRVTRDMIRKIEEASVSHNQIPFMEIEFVDDKAKPQGSACVISRHALTALLNRLADAEGTATSTFERSKRRP